MKTMTAMTIIPLLGMTGLSAENEAPVSSEEEIFDALAEEHPEIDDAISVEDFQELGVTSPEQVTVYEFDDALVVETVTNTDDLSEDAAAEFTDVTSEFFEGLDAAATSSCTVSAQADVPQRFSSPARAHTRSAVSMSSGCPADDGFRNTVTAALYTMAGVVPAMRGKGTDSQNDVTPGITVSVSRTETCSSTATNPWYTTTSLFGGGTLATSKTVNLACKR